MQIPSKTSRFMICRLKFFLGQAPRKLSRFIASTFPMRTSLLCSIAFVSISLFLFFRTRFIVNSISLSSVLSLLDLSLITLLAFSRIYSSGNASPASSKLFFTLLNTSWTRRRGLSNFRYSFIDLSYPYLCLHLIITPLPFHFCGT